MTTLTAKILPTSIKEKVNDNKEVELVFSHVVTTEDGNYAIFVEPDTSDGSYVGIYRLVPIEDNNSEEFGKVVKAWGELGKN